jgi:hypothetical protein
MPTRPKPPARHQPPKSSRDKVRAHRARLRAAGLRPIQIWVPDTRSPEFAKEAHRESVRIANSPSEAEDQAFIDAISVWNEEE